MIRTIIYIYINISDETINFDMTPKTFQKYIHTHVKTNILLCKLKNYK